MLGREREHVALAHVLGRPRFGRVLEDLRPIQIRVFVIDHPVGVLQQARAGVLIHRVERLQLDLVIEVFPERLQEHRVEPPAFGIEQVAFADVVARVDAPPDQLLGLEQKLRVARGPVARQQRHDRICRPSSRSVIQRRPGHAGETRIAAIQPPEERPAAVVHVDDPLREPDGRLPRLRVAGQKVVEQQSRRVVVFRRRPASSHVGTLRIRAVRRRSRVDVMVRVPEQRVVVRALVAVGVVHVDVDDVRRQLAHQRPPPRVPGSQKPPAESGDGVVLIVVMRDERCAFSLEDGLVIRVEIAEIAPAVFVDEIALAREGVVAVHGRFAQRDVRAIAIRGGRNQVRHGARRAIP